MNRPAVAADVRARRATRAALLRHHATDRVNAADKAFSELLHPSLVGTLTADEARTARAASALIRELAAAVGERPGVAAGPPLATIHPLPRRDTPAPRV